MKRPNLSTSGTPARPNMAGGPDARRLPSLDSLRIFEVAARRLSFTEAANELFVTQSAVSQRIKSLELELGAALFDRTPRGLRLTRTGEHLAHGVRHGMAFFALAVAGVHAHGPAGTLDVTVLPSFASLWLLSRLPDFRRSNPEIEIRLHADSAVIDLRASDMDAAIRFGDGRYPGLVATRLMGDFVVPACSPTLLAQLGPPKDVSDLARLPLLHDAPTETDGSGSGWPAWLAYVGHDQLHFVAGMRLSQANLAIEAAVRGLGVALVRWSLAEEEFASGRLVRAWPRAAPTAYSYYFICRSDVLSNVRICAFRDWLAARCNESDRAGTSA
jgi:LysR family transcriptional regulator, glycine cleavage system transcriptional activator